ncbi:MAG TPA: glycoside hydrolase family 15 protein [Candidatus Saccharibacteria bacterium]|nr:glycoside hydrolase family 15 protein [Candidatus Saccharibacteria bacterium]
MNTIEWRSSALHKYWLKCEKNPTTIKEMLFSSHSLDFPTYTSGMVPASLLPSDAENKSGMGYAWIRDNAHVANALLENGETRKAAGITKAILQIAIQYESTLDDIISGTASAENVMSRPPIRVVGDTLDATGQWPNAQNDSIGYALWIIAKTASREIVTLEEDDLRVINKFVAYLDKIEYWQDKDSGHWEEDRAIHPASIGVVIAGLEELKTDNLIQHLDVKRVNWLITQGRAALNELLSQDIPRDASLLFLVEPLHILDETQSTAIVTMVEETLLREYGIIRYPNDSYWSANYRDHFKIGDRTADFSGRLDERARHNIPGHEAQWTLFDPLLSVYFSRQNRPDKAHYYLERTLASFIEQDNHWAVPETFFFEHDAWVANDHIPLLWSQANVLLALNQSHS